MLVHNLLWRVYKPRWTLYSLELRKHIWRLRMRTMECLRGIKTLCLSIKCWMLLLWILMLILLLSYELLFFLEVLLVILWTLVYGRDIVRIHHVTHAVMLHGVLLSCRSIGHWLLWYEHIRLVRFAYLGFKHLLSMVRSIMSHWRRHLDLLRILLNRYPWFMNLSLDKWSIFSRLFDFTRLLRFLYLFLYRARTLLFYFNWRFFFHLLFFFLALFFFLYFCIFQFFHMI